MEFPIKIIFENGEEIDLREKQCLIAILENETNLGESTMFDFNIYSDCSDDVLGKLAESLPKELMKKISQNIEKKISASLDFGREILRQALRTGETPNSLMEKEENVLKFAEKLGIHKKSELEMFMNTIKEWEKERGKKENDKEIN